MHSRSSFTRSVLVCLQIFRIDGEFLHLFPGECAGDLNRGIAAAKNHIFATAPDHANDNTHP